MEERMTARQMLGICSRPQPGVDVLTIRAADKAKPASSGAKARDRGQAPQREGEARRDEDKLRKELESPYRKWLDEDVAYIITDEETAGLQAPLHGR